MIVLLQGPVGPFFGRLQRHLQASGYRTVRVNFNASDWFFSEKRNVINFAGDLAGWERWFSAFVDDARPDCVLYFGCQRPIHRIAQQVAARARIPVFSFEEGYIRPGFVTMERNGNNAMSPLAGRERALTTPVRRSELPEPGAASGFFAMCGYAWLYYVLRSTAEVFYGRTLFHRERRVVPEFGRWLRNVSRKAFHWRANKRTMAELTGGAGLHYHVVALQVHDDMQIRCHGRDWDNERLIVASLASFARSAPARSLLVFKVHPLDRGHFNYRAFIRRKAKLFGCEDRVRVLDDGSIAQVVRSAAGLITVNSTSAMSALYHGTPLLVLGDALFRHPDLATCAEAADDLDRFWTEAAPADPIKAHNFLDNVRKESLVPGSYYNRAGQDQMFARIVERIETAGVSASARRRKLSLVRGGQAVRRTEEPKEGPALGLAEPARLAEGAAEG